MCSKCGRWMEGKKRVVPREVGTERSEKSNRYRKVTLNVQKSAEATVAGSFFRRRAESIGVFSTTGKGGMGRWVQKT